MLTLEQAIKIGKYKISGGEEFLWKCFGPNAHYLDFYVEGYFKEFSIVYDSETQKVYQARVGDEYNNYCLTHPEYVEAYELEAKTRNTEPYGAYSDTCYTKLEVTEDFIEKASAIVDGRYYDTRIKIELEMPDEDLLLLCLDAHSKDITLNQLIEQVIEAEIERHSDEL